MMNPRGGQYYLNARRGRKRRSHLVRGGHYGGWGSRYQGYHMSVRSPRRRRGRRNPARGGRGGTNWLLIGGLAVGAFFLLPRLASAGGITSILGGGPAAVPPGYTPIGSGLYRAPNGQVVARHPSTGQMIPAPAGSQPTSAEDLLTRAGISLIPSVANNLASWISSMFSTQQTSTGAVIGAPVGSTTTLPSGGQSVSSPDILGGSYLPPLAPMPDDWFSDWGGVMPEDDWLFAAELPPIGDLATYPSYDYYDYATYYGDPGSYDLPGVPPVDWDVMIGVGSGDVTIANPDEWWGYFGLGRRGSRGYRATPPVY